MAKKKYYAVKKGVLPGIYTTWPEAEAQVRGYPGAQFKGFASEEEAKSWMVGEREAVPHKKFKKPASKINTTEKDAAVVIYTDGGALGNPGPGGYGAIITRDGREKVLQGGYRLTTNNRMELTACIVALQEVKGCMEKIVLYSDSSYVVNGISKGWARKWRNNNWRKSDGKLALNSDLWRELLQLSDALDVTLHWVRGHAGNPMNERCDRLAVQSAQGEGLAVDKGYELTPHKEV